nr:ATP-binding protein [Pelodictyon phaeoclathratiforme]
MEFKRDDILPEQLAKEIVPFANVQGGRIFLGVEDNGEFTAAVHNPEIPVASAYKFS